MGYAHCLSAVSMETRVPTPGAFSSSIALRRIVATLRSRSVGAYAPGVVVVSV